MNVDALRVQLDAALRDREALQTRIHGLRAQLRRAEGRQEKFPAVPIIPNPNFFEQPPAVTTPKPAFKSVSFAELMAGHSQPEVTPPAPFDFSIGPAKGLRPPFAEAYFMRQDITPEQITILNGMTEEARNAWLEANPPKDSAK